MNNEETTVEETTEEVALAAEQPVDPAEEMNKRIEAFAAIAREVLKIIANTEDLAMGNVQEDRRQACYAPVTKQIIELFLKHDLSVGDETVVMQLVAQALSFTKEMVSNTIETNTNSALEKVIGCELRNLKLSKVDSILKENKPE